MSLKIEMFDILRKRKNKPRKSEYFVSNCGIEFSVVP